MAYKTRYMRDLMRIATTPRPAEPDEVVVVEDEFVEDIPGMIDALLVAVTEEEV